MDRYSSDFQIYHFVSEEEAIEHCSQLNARTRLEQDDGKDAWQHYVVADGFEKQMQIDQCYDPIIDGPWTSQSQAECFVQPPVEMAEKIKARSEVLYTELLEVHKNVEKNRLKEESEARLRQEIARAKALLEKHPEAFIK